MDIVLFNKMDKWLKPEFVEEFNEYMNGKTCVNEGAYLMNFENFLFKKKYIENKVMGD